MNEYSYKQDTKEKSRKAIWEHAVYSLTHNRTDNRILNPEYMRKLWNYCFDENLIKYGYANTDNRHVLTDWQGYSDSIYNKKNAGDLSVAFFLWSRIRKRCKSFAVTGREN